MGLKLKKIGRIFARMLVLLCVSIFVYLILFVQYDSIEDETKAYVKLNLENLSVFLEKYRVENGRYPEELNKISPYFIKLPVDPWGDSYIYRVYDNCFELSCCLSESNIEENVACRAASRGKRP